MAQLRIQSVVCIALLLMLITPMPILSTPNDSIVPNRRLLQANGNGNGNNGNQSPGNGNGNGNGNNGNNENGNGNNGNNGNGNNGNGNGNNGNGNNGNGNGNNGNNGNGNNGNNGNGNGNNGNGNGNNGNGNGNASPPLRSTVSPSPPPPRYPSPSPPPPRYPSPSPPPPRYPTPSSPPPPFTTPSSPPPPTITPSSPPPPFTTPSPPPPPLTTPSSPPPPFTTPSPPPPPQTPSSSPPPPPKVKCTNSSYPQCYGEEHTCPDSCNGGCYVDCVTCKPKCNCDIPGAVCQDPRFIGGDGITFYFHGKKDKDFCVVTDNKFHINAHFIGKRNKIMTRDFTWVQSIGIIFGNHKISFGALKTSTWDDAIDRLFLTYDDSEIILPSLTGAKWQSSSDESTPMTSITRISDTNTVLLEVDGLFQININVVPITEEDSRVHNYGITNEDCFAHLELGFKFLDLSEEVNGVLGQTYRNDYVSRVKMGVPMPVLGGAREFAVSGLLEPDCPVSQFHAATKSSYDNRSSARTEFPGLNCSSGKHGGGGVVCKR